MRHPNKHSRIRLFLATGLIAFIFSWVTLGAYSAPTYAQTTPNTPDATGTEAQPASEGDGTTCAIEKMGWILCPAIETFGKIGDSVFQQLSDAFLETEPELVSNDPKGTKYAWEFARNIANILFIIAFLVIIYSQITSAGLSNYGIKRMLPRLIIAAILVNISYYICQAMVDISNIMGYEIQNFLVNAAREISDVAAMPPQGGFIDASTSNGTLGTIAVAGLAIAAYVWVILPILMLGVTTVVVTVLVVIVILLLRKALIILLVVASPIAFVCYLLPNTEKFFSKWLNMFWQLLMVFPVISLLFGGGQLASSIILAAGSTEAGQYSDASKAEEQSKACVQLPKSKPGSEEEAKAKAAECGDQGSTSLTMGLVAAGVAVAPLLAVWAVLKGAISAAGAMGGKISGAVDKGINSGSAWASKNTALGRGMAARQAIKQNYKDQRFAQNMSGKGFRGRTTRFAARGIGGNAGMVAGKISSGLDGKAGAAFDLATGGIQAQDSKLKANFAGAADEIAKKEIANQMAAVNRSNTPIEDAAKLLNDSLATGDVIGARAAQNVLMSSGGPGMDRFVDEMKNADEQTNRELILALKQNALQNHGGTIKEKSGAAAAWAGNPGTSMRAVDAGTAVDDRGNPINPFSGLSDSQIAKQTTSSLKFAASKGYIDPASAHRILNNTSAAEDLGGSQRAVLESLASSHTPTPPSGTPPTGTPPPSPPAGGPPPAGPPPSPPSGPPSGP